MARKRIRWIYGSGAVNGDVFAAYLDQVLGPTLVPGDVVVLDNLPAHKVAGLAELVEARGARLLYLPPYSPDFNPIELAFSKLKTWLRSAQVRTREALETVIQAATDWIHGARREKLVRPLWLPRTLTENRSNSQLLISYCVISPRKS